MSKSRKSYYAVKRGRKPGIYRTWEECAAQVQGFQSPVYKGFASLAEAEEFLGIRKPAPPSEPEEMLTEAGLKKITIYADGSAIGNPGPGGYGVVLLFGGHRKELSGGYRLTTNNRMEILACIVGLRALREKSRVTIYTDSQYVVNSMTRGWAERWRAMGWRKAGAPVLNADLWEQLLDLRDRHEVTFAWVPGHAGLRENERCDRLAKQAALSGNLAVDAGYEAARRD